MSQTSALSKVDITTSISGPMTMTQIDGGGTITATSTPAISKTFSFTYGSSAGQGQKALIIQGVIAASSNVTIDLSAALDAFGLAITNSWKVRVLGLLNTSTAGSDAHLTYGNAAANQFVGPFGAAGNTVECRVGHPALIFVRSDGWSDNLASTGKNVKLANQSGTTQASYQLLIVVG